MWARPRLDVARHQLGQPPRSGGRESEETDRLANRVEFQIGRQLLAQLDRHTALHAQLDRFIARFEVAIDQQAV